MKWKKLLENWDMSSLRVNLGFLEMDFAPSERDKDAAWDLYIELLTRITTQPLNSESGSELDALESIYSLFGTTRNVIKNNGRDCIEFTKIAVVVLNQIVRPFTSKWRKLSIEGGFENETSKQVFRAELKEIQSTLSNYTQMLAFMADVEDLTTLGVEQ